MTDFNFFMPIAKLDKENRLVMGYASTPAKDSDGEIVTLDAVKAALPNYMRWANIREMHALKAVGTTQEANTDDKGLFITAKIVDDAAWNKCLEGVYKGFSIGGRKLAKKGNKITEIDMTEISVVDRPANGECSFTLAKSEKKLGDASGFLLKAEAASPEMKALAKTAKALSMLAKANPPAAHDGFSLPAKKAAKDKAEQPDGVASVNDSRPNENVTRKAGGPEHDDETNLPLGTGATAKTSDAKKPYGDVTYADPGYRADEKKRYPIDTEEHIRAAWNYIHKKKNAAKYSSEHLAAIKSKIVAAWKAKIDKEGPPSLHEAKQAKKLAKRLAASRVASELSLNAEPQFLSLRKAKEQPVGFDNDPFVLRKRMSGVSSMSYAFDSLRDVQRSLLMEAKREGGDMKDKKLAQELGNIAKQLAAVMSKKAEHEGGEATTLTDADDKYLSNIFGEDEKMATDTNGAIDGGNSLDVVMTELVKRASEPTRAQRMMACKANMKKARKAEKEARKDIEEVHKMLKADYLNKAAKKEGKKPDGEEDFDAAKAMEKLQKAYAALDKAMTFGKAAKKQLAKATARRAGERGQEAGDPEAGFYEVPPGVKDLTPEAMATASPGGRGKGGMPPMYPGDGSVYPGKADKGGDLAKFARNGVISADVAQLLLEKAEAQGALEAIKQLPMSALGGRKPMNFDMAKAFGANGERRGDINKALFDGVDASDLNSGDEHTRTSAAAKVAGNFLLSGSFGKSVLDPGFKGTAGLGRG